MSADEDMERNCSVQVLSCKSGAVATCGKTDTGGMTLCCDARDATMQTDSHHAAQELFHWLAGLAPGHPAAALCDVYTFTAAIALCAPSHQVRPLHFGRTCRARLWHLAERSLVCKVACIWSEVTVNLTLMWPESGFILLSMLSALYLLPGCLSCPASLFMPAECCQARCFNGAG